MTLMRSDEIGSMCIDLHIDSGRWQSWAGLKLHGFEMDPDWWGKKLGSCW